MPKPIETVPVQLPIRAKEIGYMPQGPQASGIGIEKLLPIFI